MTANYSTEAVELYNYAVNERELHPLRQRATGYAYSASSGYRRLAALDTVSVAATAARTYPGGECFTTEHILEAALMLHREDMKQIAEDRANGGKGEL